MCQKYQKIFDWQVTKFQSFETKIIIVCVLLFILFVKWKVLKKKLSEMLMCPYLILNHRINILSTVPFN